MVLLLLGVDLAWSHGLFLLSGPAGIGRWRIQPTACGKFYALILSDPVCEFGWNQDGMDMCPILIRTLQTLSSDGKLLSLSLTHSFSLLIRLQTLLLLDMVLGAAAMPKRWFYK